MLIYKGLLEMRWDLDVEAMNPRSDTRCILLGAGVLSARVVIWMDAGGVVAKLEHGTKRICWILGILRAWSTRWQCLARICCRSL